MGTLDSQHIMHNMNSPMEFIDTFTDTLQNNTLTNTINGIMTNQYSLNFTYGNDVQAILSVLCLGVGFTLVFFGCRTFKFTLFSLIFTGIAGLIYFVGMSDPTSNQKAVLSIAIVLGFLSGLLAIKLWKAALFGVGAFVAFCLWVTYKSLYPNSELMTDEALQYISLIVPVILLGLFSMWMEQYWLLVATPVVGTFLFFQGLDFFANLDINVYATLAGNETCTTQQCYGIYAGMIGMCVMGMIIQYEFTSSFAKPKGKTRIVREKIVIMPSKEIPSTV